VTSDEKCIWVYVGVAHVSDRSLVVFKHGHVLIGDGCGYGISVGASSGEIVMVSFSFLLYMVECKVEDMCTMCSVY